MKNILNKINISFITYLFLFLWFITGYIIPAFLVFLIILFHELGHIMMSYLLKYEVQKVIIYPFGGLTHIKKPINSLLIDDFLIAISGILNQLIISFCFLIIYKFNLISENYYNLFNYYNYSILTFNLLPIYPLDGYKILESIVERFISFYHSQFIMIFVGIISNILFIIYNVYYGVNNYVILLFLLGELLKHYKQRKIIYNKFLLERLLHSFKFKRIAYCKSLNLDFLKRDTYHYFKDGDNIYSERALLLKKFDINRRF